jgi:acyl transferase domain-containing protein
VADVADVADWFRVPGTQVMDAAADGYGRGEACRALWLRAADRHAGFPGSGTDCMAVLVASAVNTNGKSSTLTAPHGPTQQQLLLAALRAGGVSPAHMTGLQLHANGTPLGDPIELGAAAAVHATTAGVEGPTQRRQPFAWLSVKGYGGHQEAAAGVVELSETVATLGRLALPPAFNLRSLNPLVQGPLEAFVRRCGWSAVARGGVTSLPLATARGGAGSGAESIAIFGVSSFGTQGTNAHALLSSAPLISASAATSLSYSANTASWPALGQRTWVAPEPQLLVQSASVVRLRRHDLRATMLGRQDPPALSYLWQGVPADAFGSSGDAVRRGRPAPR